MEYDNLLFTGLDVEIKEGRINISMENYAKSLESIVEIRKAERDKKLTRVDMSEYQMMVGKFPGGLKE